MPKFVVEVGSVGRAALLGLWFAVAGSLAACISGSPIGQSCETGADCESGACHEGTCVSASGGGDVGGSGTGGSGMGGDATVGGSGTGGDATGGSGTGGSGVCSPNHDGSITRAEVPLAPGLDAKFRIAGDVTFDTSGDMVAGTQTWDMSGNLSGDHAVLLETLDITGAWYADTFPGASYAVRLSDSSDLLGVFEITSDSLLLRGVVSPADGITKTELTYDPPVVVLAFPLQKDDTFQTTSTVTGYASGVYSIYTETYENQVDARGDLITPFSTFDVLRVRVDLTRIVGALVTTQKTFAFVTECFGTVATIASQLGETGTEFSDVSEIKRLTP
ncbi:MAG: hypothetical protein U0271_37370 [Polyangiaceae bacterium]